VLAALGLDGEPGIFSRGGRSGPFSGVPREYQNSKPIEDSASRSNAERPAN
jgi:hypothetical protein